MQTEDTDLDVEESEAEEFSEPDEGDYVMSGVRYCSTFVSVCQYGKFLGEFADEDAAEAFIREDMEQGQFWPNVWFISDHGNAHLRNVR